MSASDLATVKSGGVESLRVAIHRNSVSEGPRTYNWGGIDVFVAQAARAGLTVLPTFFGSASWEQNNLKVLPTSTKAIDEWTSMLQVAVRRYGPSGSFWESHPGIPRKPISVWQIWNEVNTFWFAAPVSADQYAKLVIESSKAVKSADPGAKIMLAGLYASPRSGYGMDASVYLKALYQSDGFKTSFDYAAIHPYEKTIGDVIADISKLRRTLDNRGDQAKGIYVTELGWGSDSNTGFGTGSRAAQAQTLADAYAAIQSKRAELGVRAVYWFTWKDLPASKVSCVFCYENGLFDLFHQPKPAWIAFVDVVKRDPATLTPPTASPGIHPVSPGDSSPNARKARKSETPAMTKQPGRRKGCLRLMKARKRKACRRAHSVRKCNRYRGRKKISCKRRSKTSSHRRKTSVQS